MKITGIIHKIGEASDVTEKLRKANLVIETEERYPQFIQFDVLNAKIEKLAPFFEKDKVTIDFFINGRLYTGSDGIEKCFTNLELSEITKC